VRYFLIKQWFNADQAAQAVSFLYARPASPGQMRYRLPGRNGCHSARLHAAGLRVPVALTSIEAFAIHSGNPMHAVTQPAPAIPSGYKTDEIMWQRVTGSPRFDYPIDYWVAILGVQPETGRIDFLSKWEPNSYCHYHRHLGPMTTLVLEGEQHVVEKTATETVHKVRRPGFCARSEGGDVHMEYGGPDGAVVLFMCEAVEDGKLFDVLDRDGNVLVTATIETFISGKLSG